MSSRNLKKHQLVLGFLSVLWIVGNSAGHAQTPQPQLDGNWEGTLAAGTVQLRLRFEISRSPDGVLLGNLYVADRPRGVRFDHFEVTGNQVRIEVSAGRAVFTGVADPNRRELRGSWAEGGMTYPLTLTHREPSSGATPNAVTARQTAAEPLILLPFEIAVPTPPTPFLAQGQTHLAYELHISNFSPNEVLLQRVQVLDGDSVLATFEGTELHAILARPGVRDLTDNRVLGPGLRAVAFVWLSLDMDAAIPTTLRHRIAASDRSTEGGSIRVASVSLKRLSPPLRGPGWIAGAGPANTSVHRRALIPLQGKVQISQRFAIDWVRMNLDGLTYTGDPKDNRGYLAYGKEVLAVADAVVSSVHDGIPENVPESRAVPITLENTGGNFVNLDLGDGQFAHYAHLQPGSLLVKPGDKVRRGQVLGLVGNSGNSDQPHLHFHVANADSGLVAEGLPYAFDEFDVLDQDRRWQLRRNEIPLERAVVRFPE
jgi:hypothetical protein